MLYRGTQLLDLCILGLYFLIEMRNLRWEIGDIVDELLQNSRRVFCNGHGQGALYCRLRSDGELVATESGGLSMKARGADR